MNSGARQFIFSVLLLFSFSYHLDNSAFKFLLNFNNRVLYVSGAPQMISRLLSEIQPQFSGGHSIKFSPVVNAHPIVVSYIRIQTGKQEPFLRYNLLT